MYHCMNIIYCRNL